MSWPSLYPRLTLTVSGQDSMVETPRTTCSILLGRCSRADPAPLQNTRPLDIFPMSTLHMDYPWTWRRLACCKPNCRLDNSGINVSSSSSVWFSNLTPSLAVMQADARPFVRNVLVGAIAWSILHLFVRAYSLVFMKSCKGGRGLFSLAANDIDRAAHVDVHEIHIDVLLQNCRAPGHVIGISTANLHEQTAAGVTT